LRTTGNETLKDEGKRIPSIDFEITPATPHKGYQAGFGGTPTMEAMDGMLPCNKHLLFSLLEAILG